MATFSSTSSNIKWVRIYPNKISHRIADSTESLLLSTQVKIQVVFHTPFLRLVKSYVLTQVWFSLGVALWRLVGILYLFRNIKAEHIFNTLTKQLLIFPERQTSPDIAA